MDNELLDEFVEEAREHLDVSEPLLLELENGANEDPELVDKLFRSIHSIKGAAGFLGLKAVNNLSHSMENLLSKIRSKELDVTGDAVDLLLRGTDILGTMIDDPGVSDNVNYHDLTIKLDETANGETKTESIEVITPAPSTVYTLTPELKEKTSVKLAYFYEIKLKIDEEGFELLKEELETLGEILDNQESGESSVILFATVIDPDMIDMAIPFEHEYVVELSEAKEEEKKTQVPEIVETTAIVKSSEEPVRSPVKIDTSGEKGPELKSKPAASGCETVRIHVDLLDHLMTLASELVLVRNQHLQHYTSSDATGQEISRRFNAVTSELQSSIMNIRMQPAGNVFGKLPRIVRELAKRLDKSIHIVITGEDVELDKTVLESLADPLTHIIRNCCDHGLETAEKRLAAGKQPTGIIKVEARHEGGQIIVSIADDGKGIDPEMIKRKVIEKGLKSESDLQRMTPKQLLSLIMMPGFSTASQVSDISGRGVGMDVVRSSIEKLGGTLDIDSTPGAGTTMTLALPLTLAIMSSLLVTSCGKRFAVPQLNMEEVITLFDNEIDEKVEILNGQEVYRHHDNLLQLVRLNEILASKEPLDDGARANIAENYNSKSKHNSGARLDVMNIAVVKVGSRRFGLIVDEILGAEEIVVKPMHPSLSEIKCYLGATVLGDGSVSLILDIDAIGRHGLGHIHKPTEKNEEPEQLIARSDDAQRVLLFRGGEKEQFALSLALIKRVDWVDKDKIQYVGDRKFLDIDGVPTRIISLDQALDVSPCEMKEDMFLILPKHIKRPFGILASEFSEIESTVTNFHNTSYSDGILGTSLINGQLTVFPDIYRVIEKIEPEWFDVDGKREKHVPSNVRILLAEDTPFFRQLVKKYLESDHYEVTITTNGREALDTLKQDNFDLVLSDLEMPVMNGWQFIESYKSIPEKRHIPAIALTSLDSDHDRESALKCGFSDYIVKIERERFLTKVAEFLSCHGK